MQARLTRLRPNTEYSVLLQAANDFGAGPAEMVRAKTRGDGERTVSRKNYLINSKKIFVLFLVPSHAPTGLRCRALSSTSIKVRRNLNCVKKCARYLKPYLCGNPSGRLGPPPAVPPPRLPRLLQRLLPAHRLEGAGGGQGREGVLRGGQGKAKRRRRRRQGRGSSDRY